MTYNNQNNAFSASTFGTPGTGFGGRGPRINSKKLSVALPPTVNPINEHQVDNPTPRTSRSHLLAGLRTQPRTPATPASAPFAHAQAPGYGAPQWANAAYNGYEQDIPQSAPGYDLANQYAMNAGRQMYSLPEQVLAPPSLCDSGEEMDPVILQQMQLTSLYLAQRQQQLQQQLANLTASAQSMNLNGARNGFHQSPNTPQTPHNMFGQQQVQSPIEVPGQPGLYLVYNILTQGYNYVMEQQLAASMSQGQSASYFNGSQGFQPPTPTVSVTPPAVDRPGMGRARSYTPPKMVNPYDPEEVEVEPLPPPSSNAFRRGHKKAASLFINPQADGVGNGAKTSTAATFGSQRTVIANPPMTGTFGPGGARAGKHPIRQPRGPPPLEELVALPTSTQEGSKNFATRQRRRALDSLVRAGTSRRGISRSSNGSPISEAEYNFPLHEDTEDDISLRSGSSNGSRKMSPIGTEMKEKRGSQGSSDGYFGLSSACSSESEDTGLYKQPPTPATPMSANGDRKMMMLGVLNAATAAEKRRSGVLTPVNREL